MSRNTINKPFLFSDAFLSRKRHALFRDAMLIVVAVCAAGLVLDSVVRAAGL